MNYRNQTVIENITLNNIRHNEGVQEQWLQPLSWEKLCIPLGLLTGNEYKLYMYILKWAGKGTYEFSPANLQIELGFKEDTARKSKKKLEEYGFLTLMRQNHYSFDPLPQKAIDLWNIEKAKRSGVNV